MDTATAIVRAIADILFNKQPTYSTKDIFNHIDKKDYKENIDKITQFVLKEMFCENTGSHICDSGGAYGYGYQRAQAVKDLDWMMQDSARVEVDHYSRDDTYHFYVLKNTYLFLCERLEYNLKMDQKFHQFCNSEKTYNFPYEGKRVVNEKIITEKVNNYIVPKKESYYSCMSYFKEYLEKKNEDEYIDLDSYNTYNGENCLDKTLQWEMFSLKGKAYIILQIHNGCDVRGGYSTPHVFRLEEDEFWCYLDDLTCRCPNFRRSDRRRRFRKKKYKNNKHVDCYSDDGGNHWYANSGRGIDDGAKYKTDKEGNHHILCKKCKGELEFW